MAESPKLDETPHSGTRGWVGEMAASASSVTHASHMHSLRRAGLAALRRTAGAPAPRGSFPGQHSNGISSSESALKHHTVKKTSARGAILCRGAVGGVSGASEGTRRGFGTSTPMPRDPSKGGTPPTDPAELAARLRAGLDYELKKGCPNAKGRAFADFQQFLCNHLGELEAGLLGGGGGLLPNGALPQPNVAELARTLVTIRHEAVSYGAMDLRGRDDLLRRLGSALYRHERVGGVEGLQHQQQHQQQQQQQLQQQPATPKQAWAPPTQSEAPTLSDSRQRAFSGAQRRNARPATDTKGTSAWSDSSSGSSPTATAPQALEVLQSAQHVGGASSRTSVGVGGTPVGEILLPTMAGSGSKMSTPKRSPSREIPIVIAFDLETTGLSKEKNRIIEIAAVNVTDKTHQPMSTLINPGRFSIPHHITQLTGITNSMVSAPSVPSFARAAELLEAFVLIAREKGNGAPVILAAHNARQFDAGFLQAEYRRLGKELPDEWRFVDTLPLARKQLHKDTVGGSFKLETLARHFECGPVAGEAAHRAQADARMLGDVLEGILGVSLEGTVGVGSGEVIQNRGDGEKLAAAVAAMASHSFSLGDPSKNVMRRVAVATPVGSVGSRPGSSAPFGFGATPIVTSDRGEIDVLGSGGIATAELDDLSEDEDDDDEFSSAFSAHTHAVSDQPEKPLRKPFWIAADPINGFVPETMDFARIVEASDFSAVVGESNGPGDVHKKDANPVDPSIAELHAKLRKDHSSWAPIPVDELKNHGVSTKVLNVLKKHDIDTVEKVLRCYPRKYQEFARFKPGMQNGTAVLVVGTVGSFLKAPTSRKGWGHKAPSTLLIDVRVEGDDSNPENQSTPQTVVETFEMKIWEYVPVDVERELTPGSLVCARGILSGKTTRGLVTLEKPQLAMHVDQNAQCEVVPTYPKKHDVAPDRWPEIQRAAVECLTKVLPADPMLISLGLESSVLPELNLMSHVDAMKHIHRPDSVERVCDARERLAFEELVLLQTSLLIERERAQNSGGEGVAVVSTALCDALRNVLDFSLTRGQENALEEIFHDMAGTKPMLRMLQGDVGCGKTIVAALAILAAVEAGHQGAFMAPTEVLAQQHVKTLTKMLSRLSDPPKVILLTGSMTKKARDVALQAIENGAAQIIVGTHSLISDDVVFKSLGIAVVDEQHRFGVEQRAALASKGPIGGYVERSRHVDHALAIVKSENESAQREKEGEQDGDAADAAAWAAAGDEEFVSVAEQTAVSSPKKTKKIDKKNDTEKKNVSSDSDADDSLVPWRHAPHMLAMSATPIPRTLAMCKHGEMALSSIDEKPAGRLPIFTRLLSGKNHAAAYEAMVHEVKQGGQCYIITPLVKTSESEDFARFKSAEEEFARLEAVYKDVKFGMLHGKMSADEKNSALDKFTSGATQVLVATSVVEVGVDVPNASVIIIEDADRHGVSTLHQLRGRVGRGSKQSRCFLLVGEEAGTGAIDRLKVLEKTNNGFHVAESDLRMRGAGDIYGTKQSGVNLDLFHASLQTDLFLLEAARRAAAETIARANVRGEQLPAPLAMALSAKPQMQDLTV